MKRILQNPSALCLLLILPAVVFAAQGILFLGFGLDGVNDWFGRTYRTSIGKILFSPVLVIGGPLLCLGLQLFKMCRVRLQNEDGMIDLSLSITGSASTFLLVGLCVMLFDLLLIYAFVENFVVLPR
jgi:hypothetical protein